MESSNEHIKSEQEIINEHYKHAFILYTKEEKNIYEIKKILMEKGLSVDAADKMAKDVEQQVEVELREKGKNELAMGIGLFALGCIITWMSYSNAVEAGGGKYMLAYGLIIGGAITALRGVYKLSLV